jgi:hypothetical protein
MYKFKPDASMGGLCAAEDASFSRTSNWATAVCVPLSQYPKLAIAMVEQPARPLRVDPRFPDGDKSAP